MFTVYFVKNTQKNLITKVVQLNLFNICCKAAT